MAADTHKPDADEGANGSEAARAAPAKIQPVLVAGLVAAIILMIAIGAFWTSF